jgi:putative nucleotidyltransferase with HDIG domain
MKGSIGESSTQKKIEHILSPCKKEPFSELKKQGSCIIATIDNLIDLIKNNGKNALGKEEALKQILEYGKNGRDGGHESLFLDMDDARKRKVVSVRKMLRNLNQHYKHIFKEKTDGVEEDVTKKQVIFNTNFLYLLAVTDGNEDTLCHSQLVARYTLLFAKALGIENEQFLVHIERGALLHDIGKRGIPEYILGKPGPLTEKEKDIIKEHPLIGFEMLEEFEFLKKAAQIVLFHHERYDGNGYPFGLANGEIPLEARIFALVDTLDVITSDRPYRKGKSFEEAYKEIERARGIQFDPSLVDVLLSIPKEKWAKIKAKTKAAHYIPTIH